MGRLSWLKSQTVQQRPARRNRLQFEQLETRQMLAADVVISEFLASNSTGLEDGDGDSSDWIELFNTTASAIDLSGYHLTDDDAELAKWAFPGGTSIAPGSTLLVFASDKADAPPAGELHANFKLSSGGEFLALVGPDGSTIVDSFAPGFPPQVQDYSYGASMSAATNTLVDDQSPMRYHKPTNASDDATWMTPAFDDSSWSLATAGLGYETSSSSTNNYSSYLDAVVPAGTLTAYTRFTFDVPDPSTFNSLTLQMLYDDGFVAYLNGQLVASDRAPTNLAWNSEADGPLRADELILSAYVDFNVSDHLDALQAGTNTLAIHALNLPSSSDMLMVPRLVGGEAQLDEPLMYGVFTEPTPDAPNDQVFLGVVADTKFSIDRGFYSAPFALDITTETTGATIVYTTDGSAPTVDANMNITNGTPYAGTLTIDETTTLRAAAFKSGFIPTNVDTQSYLFLSDIIQQTSQSALADGYPSQWGGRVADYGLDPDVIGPNDLFGGVYAAEIEASLLAIPSMSITVDNADFFESGGIYANPTGEGVAWERPASAELIYPDGADGFQIDAGLRIAGAASRSLSKKNGLRLLFKSEYGATKLNFPLFGDGVSKFDTVVLRPHFNDGWGWDGALGDPLFIRDQWFRDTQAAMDQPSSRGNLVHLYINGLYWGLYNPSERPDASFSAEHLGGDKDEYDVIKSDGVQDGSAAPYNTMLGLAQAVVSASGKTARATAYQHLQGNLPDGTNDPSSEDYLDVENYIDYMILNHYGGNNDWPNRNWTATRLRGEESEGFKFVAWDSEISLSLSDRTSINENNLGQSTGGAEVYGILRNYEEFRLQFADRVHEHLFNGGTLYVNTASPAYDPAHPENNVPAARFADLADSVYTAMIAESARWGDQHVSFPRTRNIDWQNSLNYMLGTYFRLRHGIVLNQWQTDGLYPSTDAPEFLVDGARQHGGSVGTGALLDFENSNNGSTGVIYYTTDGSDPRLVGGNVNTASAQFYDNSISLTQQTTVKSRILRNGEWSALTEATFVIPQADFDGSGTVDGYDFLAWQRGFGTSSTATLAQGDADADGDVDGDDLQIWTDQFNTPGAAAAPTAVPVSIATTSMFVFAAPESTADQLGSSSASPREIISQLTRKVNGFVDVTNEAAHDRDGRVFELQTSATDPAPRLASHGDDAESSYSDAADGAFSQWEGVMSQRLAQSTRQALRGT